VINQNDTVSVRPIKVGPIDGNTAQAISGLSAGERVVTDGTDRLRDGQKVTIPPPPSKSASATPQPAAQEHQHRRQQQQQ
jgi:multidrug efflux system membrane fusion protein